MMQKGQATVFIIIGLILLLSTGIFIYYAQKSTDAELEEAPIPDELDQASFTTYIESCIDQTAQEAITLLAKQGGIYDQVYYREFMGNDVTYWCYGEDTNQCVNAAITLEDIADQLIRAMRDQITGCVDFAGFEVQGYTVEQGTLDGHIIIAPSNVDFTIEYPIKVQKGEQEFNVETFHSEIDSSLGLLVSAAQHIINKEAVDGSFDILAFQEEHQDIKITRNKPYPSTIYTIEKDSLAFSFAVEGKDTATTPGEILLGVQETKYGCCYVENVCFANTPSPVCEEKGGFYEAAPCGCEEPVTLEQNQAEECADGTCNDCDEYKHGESWCEYDSTPGEAQDAPGSRHHVYACYDGEIIIDSCRDYREEICVQTDTGSKTKAVCRVNRWQDCASCTTQGCCEDTSARDCYWNEDLEEIENQCVPAVPVGVRFWEYGGTEICARANTQQTCSGLHCSQEWVDATAISCFSQADCGNDENIADVMTKQGFINTDMKYDPDEEIYETDKKRTLTNLPMVVEKQYFLFEQPVTEAVDIFLHLVTVAYQFVNQWADITVPNYLNPFTPSPEIEILDVAICLPWQAPNNGNNCGLCEEGETACSEYKCHALGKECVYQEIDGYPSCEKIDDDKKKAFSIAIDTDVMASTYVIEEAEMHIEDITYNGYKIRPELTPYKPFTIGVKSSEKSVCRIDYTPQAEYFDAPVFVMGSNEFAKHHNITMRVPPQVVVPQKIKDALNLTTAQDIITALAEPKELLEEYEEKFPAVFNTYELVTGDDLRDEIDPYVEEVLDLIDDVDDAYPYYENLSITLFDKFDNGGIYLFVTCEDQYGNTQEEEFFVEIDIADQVDDTQPPTILEINPENGGYVGEQTLVSTVYVYTDEPATCRYAQEDLSYEEMTNVFSCNNGIYDIVPVAGGSYECSTTIETIEETTVFIACADNPENTHTYSMTIQTSNVSGIDEIYAETIPQELEGSEETYEEYINVLEDSETNTTTIVASAYLLSDSQATIFNVTTTNTTIQLFTDNNYGCTIQNATTTQEMNCTQTSAEQQSLGEFMCETDITINPLFTINNETNQTNQTVYASQELQIRCNDGSETNINEEAMEYTIKKADPLEIVSISPSNNEETEQNTALTVTTSESKDITCGYAEYGSIQFLRMTQVADTVFTAVITDLEQEYNTYTIYCKDAYLNTVQETTTFYVIPE